ncbi:MAG: hypothetical protein ACP5N1_01605 [Candidatus Woesearchaeota archaeon]
MAKNYEILFREIVAPYINRIVELASDSKITKTLLHKWVLSIEHSWSEYFIDSRVDLEFVQKLNLWTDTLRDKFKDNPSEKDVIALLNKVFDASTLAYFEFGAYTEVYVEIDDFHKKVDDWMGKKVLENKFKLFKLAKEPLLLINNSVNVLLKIDPECNISFDSKKSLTTPANLEQELMKIVGRIVDIFIIYMKRSDNHFEELDMELDYLISKLKEMKYRKLLSKKQQEEITSLQKEHKKRNETKNSKNISQLESEKTSQPETVSNEKPKDNSKQRKILKNIGLVILGLLALLILMIIVFSIQSVPQTITKTTTTNVTKHLNFSENVSLTKYMNITDKRYKENVSTIGYLKQELKQIDSQTKKTKRYIVDDYGREIELVLGFAESEKYGSVFISEATTSETYRIIGMFEYRYEYFGNDTFVITVNSISREDKPINFVLKNVIEESTVYKNSSKIIFNFTYGLDKVFG